MSINELIIPDEFKTSKPASAFVKEGPIESLSEGLGSSYGLLNYRGKTWSLRYKGQTHTFVRPDDGTPSGYVDVIVLRQGHTKSKSYYPPGEYDAQMSEGKRPLCASIDGIAPDSDVQQQQAASCAMCDKNVLRTDQRGKKVKACTDYKRLAVLVMPGQTASIFNGTPLMEPLFLRVPPASLQNLGNLGDSMAALGYPYYSYITRITFDPDQPHPKMVFQPLKMLTNEDADAILGLKDELTALRITGEDQDRDTIKMLPAPVQQQLPPPVTKAPERPLALASTVAQSQPMHAPAPQGGLLGIHTKTATPTISALATAPTASPSKGIQTPEDTGEKQAAPKMATEELNAKLAALLKKPKK